MRIRRLLLVAIVCAASQVMAQPPKTQAAASSKSASFIVTLGTPGDDVATGVQLTSDGGFIIAGYTNGSGAGGQDVLLIKADAAGTVQWSETVGSTGNDLAFSVALTSDGGYVVAGETDSFNGVGQMLLTKVGSNGAFQWASTLGNVSDSAAGQSVQQTTDGGYIVTGFPGGAIGGLGLLKYDGTGQLQWLQRAQAVDFYGQSVRQTSDGGYIVAGSQQVGGAQYDLSLDKFDVSGNLQWTQIGGGANYETGNSVRQTADRGYIVAGTTASFGAGGQDILLLKYDSSGALQWTTVSGGPSDDIADSVQQTSDGGYIVAGRTAVAGVASIFLQKYDNSGTLQWTKAVGVGQFQPTSVQQAFDGGYAIAASTGANGNAGVDIFIAKTDASGNLAGCGVFMNMNETVTTTPFPSATTSYSVDSPTFDMGSPTLSVAPAKLKRHVTCR
jgi:hypothetical protein